MLFGPAVTISYFPSCSAGLDPDKYNLASLFYEAVGDEPEGKVVVLASNGLTPFQANVPVVVSSVGVFPGFYVFADSSGAVVIPDGQVEDVIERARAVESDDESYRNEIGQERLPESQRRGPRWSLKRGRRGPTE